MLNTHLDFVLQETELDAEYTSLAGNKKGEAQEEQQVDCELSFAFKATFTNV